MNKYILIIIVILAVTVLSGSGVYLYLRMQQETIPPLSQNIHHLTVGTSSEAIDNSLPPIGTGSSTEVRTPLKVVVAKSLGSCPADLRNNRILVGSSHNIFIAKIIKEIDIKTRGKQFFLAEVIFNIKGELQGVVNVGIDGEYSDDGTFHVLEGETYLWPGSTYLLVTRQSSVNSFVLVSCGIPDALSWKLLSQDVSLSSVQLQNIAENDLRVKQLQAAYPKENLDKADIYHNNTLNSYQSLTEAQKYALPYYMGSYNPNPPPVHVTSTATSTGN